MNPPHALTADTQTLNASVTHLPPTGPAVALTGMVDAVRRGLVTPSRILAWPRRLRVNPMPGMIYDELERQFGWRVSAFSYWRAFLGRYDILHVNFPHESFRNRSTLITLTRMALTAGVLSLAKLRRRRLVWIVHNISDHESFHWRLESAFMRWFTRKLDLVVHMSEAGQNLTLTRYPQLADIPNAIIPHPHYGPAVTAAISREAALAALGLPRDCKLLLAFGVIRRYKNLLNLIRAFSDLPGNDIRLLIAGIPQDATLATAIRETTTDPRVIFMLREVEESKIPILFGAATMVVAPYQDILNSGTAFMSLTQNRPILVSSRGAMVELQRDVGTDWVMLFDTPLTPLVLGKAIRWAEPDRPTPPDLSRFALERIAAAHDTTLTRLLDETDPTDAKRE